MTHPYGHSARIKVWVGTFVDCSVQEGLSHILCLPSCLRLAHLPLL